MVNVLNVPDQHIENWWETSKKTVRESLYCHRNNTIKKIKDKFQGNVDAKSCFENVFVNF